MVTLLELPREIRDLILEQTLIYTNTVPSSVEEAAENRWADFQWSWGLRHQYLINKSIGLLCANRQIYAETQQAERRLRRNPTYRLDILIIDPPVGGTSKQNAENGNSTPHPFLLLPTWTFIPALANEVGNVYATVRIPGVLSESDVFFGSNTSYAVIICELKRLLTDVLLYGPVAPETRRSRTTGDTSVRVRSITLDFVSPEDTSTLAPKGTRYSRWLRCNWYYEHHFCNHDLARTVIRPEWFALCVYHSLFALLQVDYRFRHSARLVYEQVRDIRILVDGRPLRHLDLGTLLEDLDYTPFATHFGPDEVGDGLQETQRWKKTAFRLRKLAGFTETPSAETVLEQSLPLRY